MLGVSEPAYTAEELANIDPPPFTYEGKTYTAYEAQQQMRKMERAMRKQKDRCIVADAAGDEDTFTDASIKLRRQKDIYEDFCNAAGTYTKYERTFVAGYSKRLASKTGSVTKVQNVIKNFRNRLKNIDTSGIIDPREKSFLEQLKKGSIPVNIDTKRQINHIVSKQWKHNAAQEIKQFRSLLQQNAPNTSTPKMHIPSRFYANINPEYMVAKYAGTGKFSFQKNNPFPDEFVSSRNYIGITFDKKRTNTSKLSVCKLSILKTEFIFSLY